MYIPHACYHGNVNYTSIVYIIYVVYAYITLINKYTTIYIHVRTLYIVRVYIYIYIYIYISVQC